MAEPVIDAKFTPVSLTEIRRGPVVDVTPVQLKPVDTAPPKADAPKRTWGQWAKSFFVSEPAAGGNQPPQPPKTGAPVTPADVPKGQPALPAPKGTALAVVQAPTPPAIPNAAAAEGWFAKAGNLFKAVVNNPAVQAVAGAAVKYLGPIGAAVSLPSAIERVTNAANSIGERIVSGIEAVGYGASTLVAGAAVALAPFTGGASLAVGLPIAGGIALGTAAISETARTLATVAAAISPSLDTGIKPGLVANIAQGAANLVTTGSVFAKPDPAKAAVPGQVVPGQVVPGQVVPGQVVPGQVVPGQVVPGQTAAKPSYSSLADIQHIKDGKQFARLHTGALNGASVGTADDRKKFQADAVAALGADKVKAIMERLYEGNPQKDELVARAISPDRLNDGKFGPETRAIAQALGEEAKKVAPAGDKAPNIVGERVLKAAADDKIAKTKAPAPPRGPQ